MISIQLKGRLSLALATATLVVLPGASAAQAVAPVKLVLTSHFGREVNLTETSLKGGPALEDVCATASKDECQQARPSSEPGGFARPSGVAGASDGNVYIGDSANNRVQEFTAAGDFVAMFGKDVNATTGGDICTEEEIKNSAAKCKVGVMGSAPGQFAGDIYGLAVDPVDGDVYVAESVPGENGFGTRIQKFTANGQFVLEIGKEVNETTKANLCTESEVEKAGVKCGGPALHGFGTDAQTTEHGAFTEPTALAVGGTGEHLLYVGDEHRVQEFNQQGEWKGDVSLASISSALGSKVLALAVDATGDVYLAYGIGIAPTDVIREFDPSGMEVNKFTIPPREAGQRVAIHGIAIDPLGHLAVWGYEGEGFGSEREFGSLYEAGGERLLTQFAAPEVLQTRSIDSIVAGVSFNGKGELYAVFPERSEIWGYAPVQVGEIVTGGVTCGAGVTMETSSTATCSLAGEANPYSVPNTKVWFEWGEEVDGTCLLGSETTKQDVVTVEAPTQVGAEIEGLRPNAGFCYRLAGTDQQAELPEKLTGDVVSGRTPVAAPKVIGEPSASFVTSSGVVIYGELNPENDRTEYLVEYAAGEKTLEELCPAGLAKEKCMGVSRTAALESDAYGQTGATLESRGLQPDTQYHYRLVAKNEAAEVLGTEGAPFQTAPAAQVQAQTGAAGSITATSATVTGTVNPDGQPATYTFELGVYDGAATQYSVVFSGPAGAGVVPAPESLALTGLQPGTTYAFRIEVASGYGTATGEAVLFTTAGLPAVLAVPAPLPMLVVPDVVFPPATGSTVIKKSVMNGRKLAKALKACEQKPKKQRAACKQQARKRYAKSKSANDRKKSNADVLKHT
ncbi:MAG TPA: NHL repeat-containing protein [Solirubrobacteraceae bacterium]|jgi:hypothetical protein